MMLEKASKRDNPLWETIVMALSFVALWGWFLARQAAGRSPGGLPQNPIWIGWNVLLGLALLALCGVLIRRMSRLKRALRDPKNRPGSGFPPGFPPINGGPKTNGGPKPPTKSRS